MIDPVARVPAVAPPQAAEPRAGAAAGSAAPLPAAPAPPAAASAPPEPLSVDVAQGSGGVFVYTLKDPATGTVLAVIPREDVEVGRDGRSLDRRV